MAILNYVKREIVAKIVYYGPGLSGKTLNIQKVHESMDPTNVGELTSLATESDRTLFFDFVPIQLGKIAGLETRFQLFTVPGQVFYNQTRRRVLEDCDGVVFVADSQPEQLENNLESLANLEENLAFYGKKLTDVPFVIQFNKQDIPGCMTEEELNKVLNKYNAPTIRASCVENFGVMETLAKISTTVLAHLREQMTKKTSPNAPPTGIKRTYSKEGVSDEQVVKNLLEDIANSGAAAEAQAAAAAAAPTSGAMPAPPARPAVAPAPVKPAVAPAAPPKPVTPRPSVAGGPPKPIVPGAAAPAPAPIAAASGPSLSAEDLLSGLDSPAPVPAPAKPATPARPVAAGAPAAKPAVTPSAPKPAAVAPPKPVVAPAKEKVTGTGPAAAPAAAPKISTPPPPVPAAPPPANGGTLSGLRTSSTPAPRPSPAPSKTAEELLESMERSTDAGLEQESGGSFDTPRKKKTGNPLWDADDGEAGDAPAGGGLFDDVDPGEGDGKTNVANMKAVIADSKSPSGPKKPAVPPPASTTAPAASLGEGGASLLAEADLRVSNVSVPERTADGSLEFDVHISDGSREVPIKLVLPANLVKGLAPAAKSGGGGGLALGIINLLLILGLGTFNVLVFLGVITR